MLLYSGKVACSCPWLESQNSGQVGIGAVDGEGIHMHMLGFDGIGSGGDWHVHMHDGGMRIRANGFTSKVLRCCKFSKLPM